MSDIEIIQEFKNAGYPNRVVSEFWDYGDKFRYRVYNSDSSVRLECSSVSADLIRDTQTRNELLEEVRLSVKST